MSEINFNSLADFFDQAGFGGAENAEDILRMLGLNADTQLTDEDLADFSPDLQRLIDTTTTGLSELPELFADLTGLAQTTAGVGREAVGNRFQTGQGNLQRTILGLGRESQELAASSGFAGSGAIGRRQERGRREASRGASDLFSARTTGLASVESSLDTSLFGAQQTVEGFQADLLSTLQGGISTLDATLLARGVYTGNLANIPDPLDDPESIFAGDTGGLLSDFFNQGGSTDDDIVDLSDNPIFVGDTGGLFRDFFNPGG